MHRGLQQHPRAGFIQRGGFDRGAAIEHIIGHRLTARLFHRFAEHNLQRGGGHRFDLDNGRAGVGLGHIIDIGVGAVESDRIPLAGDVAHIADLQYIQLAGDMGRGLQLHAFSVCGQVCGVDAHIVADLIISRFFRIAGIHLLAEGHQQMGEICNHDLGDGRAEFVGRHVQVGKRAAAGDRVLAVAAVAHAGDRQHIELVGAVIAGLKPQHLTGWVQLRGCHLNAAADLKMGDGLRAGLVHRFIEHDLHTIAIHRVHQRHHRTGDVAGIVLIGVAAAIGDFIFTRRAVRDLCHGHSVGHAARVFAGGQLHAPAVLGQRYAFDLHAAAEAVMADGFSAGLLQRFAEIKLQLRGGFQRRQIENRRRGIAVLDAQGVGDLRPSGDHVGRQRPVGDIMDRERISGTGGVFRGRDQNRLAVALQLDALDRDRWFDAIVAGVGRAAGIDGFAEHQQQFGAAERHNAGQRRRLTVAEGEVDLLTEAAFISRTVVGGHAEKIGRTGRKVLNHRTGRLTHIDGFAVHSGFGSHMHLVAGQIRFRVGQPLQLEPGGLAPGGCR
ncbi:MAG: hypothetical protein BWY83_00683 [bacterium ADurb.Bin478]|nr:MAG: hypothetical protein BWY83_00683 [bacterium ADurb.Bin478]